MTAPPIPDGVRFTISFETGSGEKTLGVDGMIPALPDDPEWVERYVRPALNCLFGKIAYDELGPNDFNESYRWEAEAAIGKRGLSDHEASVIARRRTAQWPQSEVSSQ